LSYVLIVCTVPLPPGVNPIAVDKYIKDIKVVVAVIEVVLHTGTGGCGSVCSLKTVV